MHNTSVVNLSVITINFNDKLGLEKTIDSVLNQTCRDFEFIVIDGKSTDGSVELIEKYSDNISYWVSEKDNGIYDAMNKGILVAKGNYLMFLNGGDVMVGNEVIKYCIDKIIEFPAVDVFYGNIILGSEDKSFEWKHPKNLDISFFKSDNLNHQSALMKADFFKIHGLYPEKYKLAGDHWAFLVNIINNRKFLFIEKLLVFFDGSGLSSTRRAEYNSEMSRMWSTLVPGYVDDLVNKYSHVKYAASYPFLKNIELLKYFVKRNKKNLILLLMSIPLLILLLVLFRDKL